MSSPQPPSPVPPSEPSFSDWKTLGDNYRSAVLHTAPKQHLDDLDSAEQTGQADQLSACLSKLLETDGPLSVWEALGQEFWEIRNVTPDISYRFFLCDYLIEKLAWDRFQQGATRKTPRGAAKTAHDAAEQRYRTAEQKFANYLAGLFHRNPRQALCFSGGGIRSASFSLGVLQALAHRSKLENFDYLSTVSGGGYTGAWLSGWITCSSGGAAAVRDELAQTRLEKFDPEPKPLLYLRNFVSYLNPRLGLMSADTWTLASTVVRNILLNWLVLLPLIAAVLVLPRLFYGAIAWHAPVSLLLPTCILSGFFAAVAACYIALDLPRAIDSRKSQRSFLLFCLAPTCLSCLGLTLYWSWRLAAGLGPLSAYAPVSFVVVSVFAGLSCAALVAFFTLKDRGLPWKWMSIAALATLAAAALGTWLGYLVVLRWLGTQTDITKLGDGKFYTWLAIPLALVAVALMQAGTVAFASDLTEDEDREWWARSVAWLLLAAVLWIALTGVVLFASDVLNGIWAWVGSSTAALLGWIASRLGKSPSTEAGTRTEKEEPLGKLDLPNLLREWGLKLVVPAFLVLLVLSLARAGEVLSHALGEVPAIQARLTGLKAHPPGIPHVPLELLTALVLALPALLAARFINANKFSLHAMYRMRLIRTFLGASHPGRQENPFTGFDPEDNLPMANLHRERPFHVVNCALNLVKGDKLAWQQRKAESFTITRLHSGSCRVGYQNSEKFGRPEPKVPKQTRSHVKPQDKGGITLGGAITISGAAASPNMGYHSSAMVTMIMTLFNARLGAWLANPGEAGRGIWQKESPTFAVRPFIDEAFGLTTDSNAWIYLSDGGHFENLALYEMVLRRCRTILVVDASCDPAFNYEDLGNAIRKIRIDMGIPIEFGAAPAMPKKLGESGSHSAVARIMYSCVDKDPNGLPAEDGTLLYIKPSLNGNEPQDVLAYARLNQGFPHESTADQWFDEPQFESYRRLGFHCMDEVLQDPRTPDI